MDAMPPMGVGTRSRQAYFVVALLSLMFAMSLLDRLILAILATPIAASLHLTDPQLGLLMGTSFAVLYSLASLPLGHGLDLHQRKRLVVFGVTLWSAMTIASAFATNFPMLLIARAGVAIGESVLTPAAISLFADLFAKDKRALPMTIYTSVGAFMATASFAVGGAALAFSGSLASPGFEPWRVTLIIVGAPGLVLAALFMFVREPPRVSATESQVEHVGLGPFLGYLRQHWRFYAPLLMCAGAYSLFNFSMHSWTPTILTRAHGLSPSDAGLIFGFVITPIQLVALFTWPWLASRLERKHPAEGIPRALVLATLWAVPFCILAPLMAHTGLFLGGIGLSIVTSAAFAILSPLAFQHYVPSRMTARVAALNLLIGNLVGFGLGPVLTVYLGRATGDLALPAALGVTAEPLARGLAVIGLIAAPIAIACAVICTRTARRVPIP